MKTLDEAIQHFTEKAEELREEADKLCEIGPGLSGHDLNSRFDCLEHAEDCEQYAAWLKELKARQDTEPILYKVTIDGYGGQDNFVCETIDERNIGLAGIRTSAKGPYDLFRLMNRIAEKYAEAGFRVVFKFDTDVDGE